jgi:hypothetical protein
MTRVPLTAATLALSTTLTHPIMGQNDEFFANEDAFIRHVETNPITADAVWLEMLNALNEWEKIVLVFGFADGRDFAACDDLRDFAANQNPNRDYRCNPVN